MKTKIIKKEEFINGDELNKEEFIEKLKNETSLIDFFAYKEKIIKELKGGN